MKKIIELIDREDSEYTYFIQVSDKQFDKAKRIIETAIDKWYGVRSDYYSNTYGGVLDFIECKLEKAKIDFDTPQITEFYY